MNPSISNPGLLARAAALAGAAWIGWAFGPGVEWAALFTTPVTDFGRIWLPVFAVPVLAWILVLWLPRLLWDHGAYVWATAVAALYLYLTYESGFRSEYPGLGNTVFAQVFGPALTEYYFGLLVITGPGVVAIPAAVVVGIYMFVPRAFVGFRDGISASCSPTTTTDEPSPRSSAPIATSSGSPRP